MKQSEFRMTMANRYCRQCINHELGINLRTEDCGYAIYPNKCQKCGSMKNIVESLRWNAQYKILFAKSIEMEE